VTQFDNQDLLARTRRRADRFIHHPVTEFTVLFLILASVVMMVMESGFQENPQRVLKLEIIGNLLTGVFIIELLIRYWVARKKKRFFSRYWLDILAVLPIVRPLRFFRVLRVLRLFRAGLLMNRRFSSFQTVFRGTASELTSLTAGSLILVLSAAVSLVLAEGTQNDQLATFEGALWFSIFSLVGGEPIGATPQSDIGNLITLILMVGGLTVFGMFVGTISAGMVARLSKRLELQEMDLDELMEHVVICGWNRSGATIVRELFGRGTPKNRAVVLITENEKPPSDFYGTDLPREHLYHHSGDWTRVPVLEGANITEASAAILLTDGLTERSDQDKDARTVLAALTIEQMNPEIYTIAEVTGRQNEEMLRHAGVEEIVVGDWYAGVILGSASRNRGLVRLLDQVLTTEYGNAFYTLTIPKSHDGKTVAELHKNLMEEHRALMISVENITGTLDVNPPPQQQVQAGQQIVVLATNVIKGWT
jgi:voltage-gated potassium channel